MRPVGGIYSTYIASPERSLPHHWDARASAKRLSVIEWKRMWRDDELREKAPSEEELFRFMADVDEDGSCCPVEAPSANLALC